MPRICKVLIVENDDFVRQLLAEAFDQEGFLFTSVENGSEVEIKLEEDDYDIAVIDVILQGDKDGFALAEIARAQGCGVILMTGDHRRQQQLGRSGHDYLLKPFRLHELMAMVDQVMARAAIQCVRRKRSDGSLFPQRST